jgi:hypothetical protein
MKGFPIRGAAAILGGDRPLVGEGPLPEDDFIPKNVRRRISRLIGQVLRATKDAGGLEAATDGSLVFATANGEINTIGAILPSLLADEPQVSPTLFHNSVHNAAPGYWAILAKRLAASTTITMGAASFEAAMLEAWTRLHDGEPEVQVTVGDEAITAAAWADPSHCTQDFCGSLRMVLEDDGPLLGWLTSVALLPDGPAPFDAVALAEVLEATEIADDPATLPGGAAHPLAGAAAVLSFLLRPGDAGRLLLARPSPAGGRYVLVFDKEAHG